MDDLMPVEEALAGLPEGERTAAAGPVLVARVVGALGMDEDDVNAATRRGLLLAAAEGNPLESCAPGSRAALETAADLTADGYGAPLAAALGAFARALPDDVPHVRAAVEDLQDDPRLALESLAVVVLHQALDGA